MASSSHSKTFASVHRWWEHVNDVWNCNKHLRKPVFVSFCLPSFVFGAEKDGGFGQGEFYVPADRVEGHKLRTRERRPANRTKVGSAVIRHDSEQIKKLCLLSGACEWKMEKSKLNKSSIAFCHWLNAFGLKNDCATLVALKKSSKYRKQIAFGANFSTVYT